MKSCIYHLIACVLVSLSVGVAHARLPPPSEVELARAAAAKAKAAREAKREARALSKAQDRAVANYKRNHMPHPAPRVVHRLEKLACKTGTEDRQARIGIEVFRGKVNYFAYYSKWKPRTCSIDVRRGDAYSRWEDHGATSKVTLVDDKGIFLINGKKGRYRFVFRNVDRMRYCGMDGKINGSLTIIRGKSKCVLHGVMDGHAG